MRLKAVATPSDEELVQRFEAGDSASFDELVRRYQRKVYRIAYRFTRDHGEADDLAQETFCRAFTGLKAFRGEASVKTWLCRIVSNLSLNAIQSARWTRRDEVQVETLAEKGTPATVAEPVGADALINRERERRLTQAVQNLPPKQKATLILRAYEGLAYKEIARIMDCTTGTAKANYFHAVTFLRKELS